jgi:gamma-glutamylcyclotransferase (GGCT)/AIG2-like uncharacterized protein YtfP
MDELKIFVYGTLKSGGFFDKKFLQKNRLSTQKAVLENAALYDLGAYPGLKMGHTGLKVHGEIHTYKNRDKVLQVMDCIEGYSGDLKDSLFVRRETSVYNQEKGIREKAFIYEYNYSAQDSNAALIEKGVW